MSLLLLLCQVFSKETGTYEKYEMFLKSAQKLSSLILLLSKYESPQSVKLIIKFKIEVSNETLYSSLSALCHVSSQAYFYLECLPRLNEVFLQYIVKSGIKLFAHILDDQRSSQRKRIFQMGSEILVVEGCDLMENTI